jgi:hypothetical protein
MVLVIISVIEVFHLLELTYMEIYFGRNYIQNKMKVGKRVLITALIKI